MKNTERNREGERFLQAAGTGLEFWDNVSVYSGMNDMIFCFDNQYNPDVCKEFDK